MRHLTHATQLNLRIILHEKFLGELSPNMSSLHPSN